MTKPPDQPRPIFSKRPLSLIIFACLLLLAGLVAGAQAQSEGLTVSILTVESADFPRVTTSLTVWDAAGPVTDLEADRLQIVEASQAASASNVSLEPAEVETLQLVLAVDRSSRLDSNTFPQMQQVANDLLGSFGGYKTMLVTFADTVELSYETFSNNRPALHEEVAGLTRQGDQTALYQAILEALDQLAQNPGLGRPAIIVLIDSQDNTGAVPVAQLLSRLQEARIPLYILGFGDRVQLPAALTAPGAFPGGYRPVAQAEQATTVLTEIETELRRGYRLSFTSGLAADNGSHNFSVVIGQGAESGQAEGSFTAVPQPVSVDLPEITPGQTLAGEIKLTPQLRPSDLPFTVTYRLDTTVLAETTNPPYSFTWDTTTAVPATHTLTVQAQDQAGNSAEHTVVVVLRRSPRVSLTASSTQIEVGDQATVQATIEAGAEIVKAELLLNEVVIATDTEAPYAFAFNSGAWAPGFYELTVRVTDALDQTGTGSAPLQILPLAPAQPAWFERLLADPRVRTGAILTISLVGLLALLLLTLRLVRLITAALRWRSNRSCQLEIANLGNIRSHYLLQAQDALGGLTFQFLMDGRLLPAQTAPLAVAGVVAQPGSSPIPAAPSQPGARPATHAPATAAPTPPAASAARPATGPSRAGQTLQKAKAGQAKAHGCLYSLVDILDALGSLLPGAAGRSVRQASASIYDSQMAVQQAQRAPVQAAYTAQYLKDEVSQAVPQRAAAGGTAPMAPAPWPEAETAEPQPASASPRPDTRPVVPVGRRANGNGGSPLLPPGVEQVATGWLQTPLLEPADTILVEVRLQPKEPFKAQVYDFVMLSKPLEPEQPAVDESRASVEIKGLAWFWRVGPIGLIVLLGLLMALLIVSLAMWRLSGLNVLAMVLGN